MKQREKKKNDMTKKHLLLLDASKKCMRICECSLSSNVRLSAREYNVNVCLSVSVFLGAYRDCLHGFTGRRLRKTC